MTKKSSTVDVMSVVVAVAVGIIAVLLAASAMVGAFKLLMFVLKL